MACVNPFLVEEVTTTGTGSQLGQQGSIPNTAGGTNAFGATVTAGDACGGAGAVCVKGGFKLTRCGFFLIGLIVLFFILLRRGS